MSVREERADWALDRCRGRRRAGASPDGRGLERPDGLFETETLSSFYGGRASPPPSRRQFQARRRTPRPHLASALSCCFPYSSLGVGASACPQLWPSVAGPARRVRGAGLAATGPGDSCRARWRAAELGPLGSGRPRVPRWPPALPGGFAALPRRSPLRSASCRRGKRASALPPRDSPLARVLLSPFWFCFQVGPRDTSPLKKLISAKR